MSGDSSSFSTLRTSAYVPGQAYNAHETGQTESASRESQSDGHDGMENSDMQTQPLHQQAVLTDNELLANRVAELEKKLANTEKDNRTLRSIIFKLSAPPQPHEDDGFYIMKLNSLDVSIERFVAQSFKDATDNYLDPEYAYYIRQVLGLYRPGRALLRFLDQRVHTSISAIYSLSFPRMVLVRHIIALCLWAHVFTPICFGVSDEVNKSMAKLFDYVSAAGMILRIPNLTTRKRLHESVVLPPSHWRRLMRTSSRKNATRFPCGRLLQAPCHQPYRENHRPAPAYSKEHQARTSEDRRNGSRALTSVDK